MNKVYKNLSAEDYDRACRIAVMQGIGHAGRSDETGNHFTVVNDEDVPAFEAEFKPDGR